MRNREGEVRDLESYRVTDFGLYGRRLFHRSAARAIGQRVWLLPTLGLRVISWIPRPGVTGIEDYYIDIAAITVTGRRFHMTDYYLDIQVWEGERAQVIDEDEFIAAVAAGHLNHDQATQAMSDAFRALDGIARHGYRLGRWLGNDHGIHLTEEPVLRSATSAVFHVIAGIHTRRRPLSDSTSPPVTDRFNRPMGSLRISVTDRCNLRCRYCMPEDEYAWLPKDGILTFEEVVAVARVFVSVGVDRIRITGGEPLLRPGLSELVAALSAEPGVTDLSLTTNGVLLAQQAARLRAAGLDRITVSLDTLHRERFKALSRRGSLSATLRGIDEASAQFGTLKIDTVVIRGFNHDELASLIEYAKQRNAEVRFIEYMDVGGATDWSRDQVYSRAEMLAALTDHYGPIRPVAKTDTAPADRFVLPDGTVFGIISSTTEPFCHTCDRSRLTADGMWLRCLYAQTGTDLRRPLREGAGHDAMVDLVTRTWRRRDDRGAVERASNEQRKVFVSLDNLKRDPHLEMHTRGG